MGIFKQLNESIKAGANRAELVNKGRQLVETKKVPDREISIQEMAMCVQMPDGSSLFEYLKEHPDFDHRLVTEALNTSMFPIIVNSRLAGAVQDAYNAVPAVLDPLVTKLPGNLNQKDPNYPLITRERKMTEVLEGAQYPANENIDSQAVTMHMKKYGEIVSITKELIMFDQTGQLLSRASDLGRDAAEFRQQTIAEKVTDKNSDVLYKNGSQSATALYVTTAWSENTWPVINMIASNGLSLYEEAIRVVRKNLLAKKDLKGNKINVIGSRAYLLCMPEDEAKALQIRNTMQTPDNSKNAINPMANGQLAGTWDIVVSPYFDHTSATASGNWKIGDWYFGYFDRQFVEATWWPISVVTQDATSEDAFNRDIVSKFKVSHAFGIFATNYLYVVKSRSASS